MVQRLLPSARPSRVEPSVSEARVLPIALEIADRIPHLFAGYLVE